MKVNLRATRNRIAKRFATALNRLNHYVQHWIETLETTPLTEPTPYKTVNSLEFPGSSSPKQPIQQRAKVGIVQDDRNQTQLNHQSPGEDLDRFFSVALDLLCIANLDGYFLQLNPLWEKTLGYTLEELKHCKFLDFVHPEDINSTRAALAALSEQQEVLNFVNRYRHRDGSYRWIEWRSIPVSGLIYASARDITEQKQAEAALRQSEAKNRAMLAAIPDLLLRIKLDGTCLDFIPPSTTAASNFLPIQSNVAEVLPPPVWQHQQQRMQQAFLTGELQVWKHQLLKNGCLCEEEVRLVPCGTDECLIIVRDITEQKRSEEALRKSEERWQLAIEATNDGIWDHNLSTDEHFLSPRCMEILGYDYTEIDSFTKWLECIHPEDQAVLQTTLQAYLEHKTPIYAAEYRMRCKDGHYKWLLAKGKAFWDETGTPLRAIGSITDITSRKQAEVELQQLNEELEQRVQRRTQALRQAYAQLQDSEARFQTFMNNSPTVSWISDANGVIVYVSQNYYHTFQLSTSEAVGQSIFQLYSQDVAQQFLDNIREVIRTNQVVETVTGAVRTDGTIGEFLSYTFPLSGSSGQCLVGGVAIDITERRQAEEAIRLSQEQLQLAVEGSGDGLWDWNVVTGDTYLSPRWLGMLDYEAGELPATIETWEDLIHPEDRPTVMSILDAHLHDAAIPYQVEFRARTKTGDWRWVLDYGKVVTYTAEGQPLRMVGLQRDITDRKLAEDALRASETRLAERNAILQSVIESTPDVVFVKDVAGRIVIANTSFVRFFDQPLSALLGKSDTELWSPEMARRLRELDLRIMTTGIAETLEEAVPHPNGTGMSTYLTTKSPWYDDQGNILGTIGLSRDISDRKLAEDALQAERLRLQLALDAAQMGTWSCSLQTNTLTWSDRTQEIFGFMPGTFPKDQETFLSLVHPADRDRLMGEITHISETGAPYTHEYRIQRLDGEVRWIAEWGIIPQDSPTTDRQLIGVVSDITARKHSEAALRDSEERFRVTFEQAAVGMVQVDLAGRFVRVNQTFCDIVGYSESELSLRTFREITHPEDLAEDESNLARLLAGEIPSFVREKRYIRPSGEVIWANLSVSLVRGVSGAPQYFIAVVENINDRKQAEQDLRQINAELERRVEERTTDLQQAMESAEAANRAKSIFLANMSHELRTPLNVILGFAQLMTRDRNLPAEKRQQLSTINRSGKHLLNLINDILEMSKIEAGRVSFTPTGFDLYTLLALLEDMFHLRVREKGLRLKIEHNFAVPRYVQTDENKLRQVLINLLSNAIKFTQQGSVTLRVITSTQQASENLPFPLPCSSQPFSEPSSEPLNPQNEAAFPLVLTFEVQDTGIGIAADELESLFEPFIQSGRRYLTQEGTGLGLSISRQFVRLMGGELMVESTPDVGSTFRFSIPVQLTESCNLSASFLPDHRIHLAPNQPAYRILVAEDNAPNRQLLLQLLQLVGFEVQGATNGQEAIALWESWHPQLIWMDMRMPILDGYEATQQIRQRELQTPTLAATVIIALTANVFEEDRARALDVGCNDFVRKPFQEAELLQKIRHYLGVEYCTVEADPSESPVIPFFDAFNATAALQTLAESWLTQFYDATIALDSTQMTSLIEQIALEHPMLATYLQQKIDNFDLQQILELLQEVRQIQEQEKNVCSRTGAIEVSEQTA